MRSIAIAAVILAATPVDAAACHRFARWYYPWPQGCHVEASGRPSAVRPVSFHLPRPDGGPEPSVGLGQAEFALPLLTRNDCEGGEADELTRARLMLRAAMEAQ